MTKEPNKEIMTTSRLRNKFHRFRSKENKNSNPDIKDVNNNERNLKIVKPLFSEKVTVNENITLVNNNKIIFSDIEIAEKLNTFFSNVVKELNIKIKENFLCDVSNINNPVERAIQKYKNHPSLQMIKETFNNYKTFSFDLISPGIIFQEIVSLDTNKSTHSNDVAAKIVKANTDLFSIFVSNDFNKSVISCKFLSILKLADITPVRKKKLKLEKSNYRPVTLLTNILKLFERFMLRQILEYFKTIFSKIQFGYRKGYGTQDCLLVMVVNCKSALDQGKEYGALLTDLSKAFDCHPHDLIVARFHACAFLTESLKLTNSYLTESKQKVKINDQYSS